MNHQCKKCRPEREIGDTTTHFYHCECMNNEKIMEYRFPKEDGSLEVIRLEE